MTNPTNGMDIGETLGDAFRDMVDAAESMLANFAAVEVERAKRLTQTHERLKDSLGADHPRVKTLETAVSRARTSGDRLTTATKRRRQQRQPSVLEWIVSGEVRNVDGEPLPGLRARVVGPKPEDPVRVGGARTDERGSFTIVYQGREPGPAEDRTAALRLQIEDDSGKVLYLSSDELRVRLGRIDYFDIVLTGGKPPRPDRPPADFGSVVGHER